VFAGGTFCKFRGRGTPCTPFKNSYVSLIPICIRIKNPHPALSQREREPEGTLEPLPLPQGEGWGEGANLTYLNSHSYRPAAFGAEAAPPSLHQQSNSVI